MPALLPREVKERGLPCSTPIICERVMVAMCVCVQKGKGDNRTGCADNRPWVNFRLLPSMLSPFLFREDSFSHLLSLPSNHTSLAASVVWWLSNRAAEDS